MPTLATMVRLLREGFATLPRQFTDSTVFTVVEGRGELRVGTQHFSLTPRGIVVVTGWPAYTLHAASELVLFSYCDRVALEKARFDTFAFEPISWSPDEITRATEVKSKVYEQLVKRGNISLE